MKASHMTLAAMLTLASLSSAAHADSITPEQVAAAVSANDWPRAESMLKEVLRHRDSAKAHYNLAEVYAHELRHGEALEQYRDAQRLDPSLSFASSKALFIRLMGDEQSIVGANAPMVMKASSDSATTAIDVATSDAMPRFAIKQPITTAPQSDNQSTIFSAVLYAFFGGILIVVLIAGFRLIFFPARSSPWDSPNRRKSYQTGPFEPDAPPVAPHEHTQETRKSFRSTPRKSVRQTTVINAGSSSDGFLTGYVIGSMASDARQSDSSFGNSSGSGSSSGFDSFDSGSGSDW